MPDVSVVLPHQAHSSPAQGGVVAARPAACTYQRASCLPFFLRIHCFFWEQDTASTGQMGGHREVVSEIGMADTGSCPTQASLSFLPNGCTGQQCECADNDLLLSSVRGLSPLRMNRSVLLIHCSKCGFIGPEAVKISIWMEFQEHPRPWNCLLPGFQSQ